MPLKQRFMSLKATTLQNSLASVTGTSHGSVGLEKRLMLQEEAQAKLVAATAPVVISAGKMFPNAAIELGAPSSEKPIQDVKSESVGVSQ
jgi:hypothetical protein